MIFAEGAPFFDAIYDAINGNGRRSYGYEPTYRHPGYGSNGYGTNGYDYNGYGSSGYGDQGHRPYRPSRRSHGKTFKDICRVHYPNAVAFPGDGGIVCPY
ncbi:hypothetical protein EVAR_74460_1 [Eumeta japonica]|uniref:Uncharacterized protein n=1 Tax=Eumeta variegata TaxID=151549 RepID=A0A4C1YJ44_EUMVA|nr:hypothetical protein EVAR_74460_1 [Eumeta japonica]